MTAGISLERTDKEHAGIPAITFNTQEGLPQEGYKLSVTPANITITASQPNGFSMLCKHFINFSPRRFTVKYVTNAPTGLYQPSK